MKRTLSIIAVSYLFSLLALAVAASSHASENERVVAEVNGAKLTEVQLMDVLRELIPQGSYHSAISPETVKAKKKDAMDELIRRELFYQEARRIGLRVKSSEINERYAAIEKQYGGRTEFERILKASGYTQKTLKKDIERNMLVTLLYNQEVLQKARVSDEFLSEYYKEHEDSYTRPESLHVRHIMIKVPGEATPEEREEMRKRAEEVDKKAKAGEDFAQLAWEYSMDDYRVKGGDLGIIHRGRLLPPVEDAAFKLKPGQVSGVITTDFGFHIVKVEEKIPPTKLSFEEVKDKLRQDIEKKRIKEAEDALLERLKTQAKIIIYDKASK